MVDHTPVDKGHLPDVGAEGRRRGRPTPEEAEAISQKIISAAKEIFTEHAFEDASIEAIAARAHVKKNTIYKRFVDKRAILQAVLIEVLQSWEVDERPVPTDDVFTVRLKKLATRLLEGAISREVRIWSRLAEHAWPSPDELGQRRDALGYDRAVALLEDEIAKAVAEDGMAVSNPHLVASSLMSILTGWADTRGRSDDPPDAEISEFASAAVDLITLGRQSW
ncbi:MAG TPA: TetR/AcrR family transcriptional regulator [Sphingobium sp.]|uniref:TetR/AcrR family transcriptional regulator n=1 Tax=Sphingobium sp. TaxID=1912891 RepID=UPI002ED4F874